MWILQIVFSILLYTSSKQFIESNLAFQLILFLHLFFIFFSLWADDFELKSRLVSSWFLFHFFYSFSFLLDYQKILALLAFVFIITLNMNTSLGRIILCEVILSTFKLLLPHERIWRVLLVLEQALLSALCLEELFNEEMNGLVVCFFMLIPWIFPLDAVPSDLKWGLAGLFSKIEIIKPTREMFHHELQGLLEREHYICNELKHV